MMDGSRGGKSLPHQGNPLPRCQGCSWGAGQGDLKPFKLKKGPNKGCGDMFYPLGCDIQHVRCHQGFMSQSVCFKGSVKKKLSIFGVPNSWVLTGWDVCYVLSCLILPVLARAELQLGQLRVNFQNQNMAPGAYTGFKAILSLTTHPMTCPLCAGNITRAAMLWRASNSSRLRIPPQKVD